MVTYFWQVVYLLLDRHCVLKSLATPSAPNRQAWANEHSTFLIRNTDVQGDEMDEFAYVIDI